ncbi:MAG: lysophospholipid acyltransferase family protein [Melioribacteraceae bacterium]
MLLKYRLEYLFFILIGKFLSLFGYSSTKYTSQIISVLFFYILKLRREVSQKNISLAFPRLTKNEVKKIAYSNYQSVATTFLELFLFPKFSREEIKSHLEFSDKELIIEKLKEGKGLILLTAHFGNWELGATAVGIHLDQKINVLAKSQSNSFIKEWLKKNREKFGNKEILLGASVKEIFKALANNEIVGVVGDQRGSREGVKVKYFNQETYTFAGTAAIVLKTKCPVLVLFSVRNSDGKYEAKLDEINIEDFTGTTQEQIIQFNQKYMSILEKYVKQYPEQWFWMHNIWKY